MDEDDRDDEVLTVTGLTVKLEGRVVVDRLDIHVARGEILTILGPNGAGKTVLLRALLGRLPHEGSIRWKRGTRIGYVPQRLPYVRNVPLTVADFFALKPTARSLPPVAQLLGEVGLDRRLAVRRMGELSSGQFQRVLIAWALAGAPDVVLLDEPTTGVDVRGEETVNGLVARIHRERNTTMLIVTHDLAVVHLLSSRVLCLDRGAVCQGAPIDVLTAETLQRLHGTEVRFFAHAHGAR